MIDRSPSLSPKVFLALNRGGEIGRKKGSRHVLLSSSSECPPELLSCPPTAQAGLESRTKRGTLETLESATQALLKPWSQRPSESSIEVGEKWVSMDLVDNLIVEKSWPKRAEPG